MIEYMKKSVKTLAIAVLALFIGGQSLQAQTRHALIVGISDYGNAKEDPNKWSNISGQILVELTM